MIEIGSSGNEESRTRGNFACHGRRRREGGSAAAAGRERMSLAYRS